MSTRYKLVHPDFKETFDLGKGYWHNIFDYKESFTLKEIVSSEEELAQLLDKNKILYTTVRNSTLEKVAKRIWDWADNKTLYFGNDISMTVNENNDVIDGEEYDSSGHIYW